MERKIVHEFKCDQPSFSFMKTVEGNYCNVCKTIVIDFSGLTNQQIIDIISAHGGNVCGSIFRGQLEDGNVSSLGFRNTVAATGLAVMLGVGAQSLRATNLTNVQSEIVMSGITDSYFVNYPDPQQLVIEPIETPDKPPKKKKERKRRTFMRIGSFSFYTQNVFPFIGAGRIVKGRMKY